MGWVLLALRGAKKCAQEWSFHVFTVVGFIFDAEGLLGPAVFPVLLGDDAVGLIETLRWERVRTEIAGEALDGEL